MPLTEIPLIFEGDLITYSRGTTVYKVTRVKQVKAYAVESGTGRRVEVRLEHCHKAPEGTVFVEDETEKATTPALALGMAVRFKNPTARNQGVFVVLNKTNAGWKVARLGGSEGMRYFHSIDADRLVPVPEINSVNWV